MKYIEYNREERDLCAHLFRLLLEDQPHWRPLQAFLGVTAVVNPQVYCEAALIRDAYYVRRLQSAEFLTKLCDIIARQEKVAKYTPFHELPEEMRNPAMTHPRQIRYKLRDAGLLRSNGDQAVYGSLQAMFNAKPDLAVCNGRDLFVFEAKLTLGFDREQLERTKCIGEVWSKLLYPDLGYDEAPAVHVRTIGLSRFEPSVSWEQIHTWAEEFWGNRDYSTVVLSKVRNI